MNLLKVMSASSINLVGGSESCYLLHAIFKNFVQLKNLNKKKTPGMFQLGDASNRWMRYGCRNIVENKRRVLLPFMTAAIFLYYEEFLNFVHSKVMSTGS